MMSCKWLIKQFRNCATWPARNRKTILSEKSYTEFQNSLPKIYSKGFAQTKYLTTPDIRDRIQKVIDYFTLERVQLQGQLTIFAYQQLENAENITDDSIHQINTIAWCIEMVQSYYLILDDIEDEAKTRNGKPCWHLLPNVGTLALNDTSMMRSFIHEILRQNLSNHMYTEVNKIFNETYLRSEYGQYLDASTARSRNFSNYNLKLFAKISENKFTFYSIKFPLLIALTMANKLNKETIRNVDHAMENIGCWIQMHNDIMDWCDELTTGKTNIDIKKGKPSWLAATALERCNDRQREIFLSSYGSDKPEDVKHVLNLYEELGLRELFYEDHRKRLDNIAKQIDSLPDNSIPSPKFFHDVVEKLYPFVVFLPKLLELDLKKQ